MSSDPEIVFATKFHLFNGTTASLRCSPSWTFQRVKEELWKKKHLTERQAEFELRLANGEVWFDDNKDTFQYCVDVTELFNENTKTKQLIELCLLPKREATSVEFGEAAPPIVARPRNY